MKRLVTALALGCVLSVPALAGDIPTLGAPQPPPQGIATSPSKGDIPTVLGDIPSGGFAEQVSSEALTALLSVLGFITV